MWYIPPRHNLCRGHAELGSGGAQSACCSPCLTRWVGEWRQIGGRGGITALVAKPSRGCREWCGGVAGQWYGQLGPLVSARLGRLSMRAAGSEKAWAVLPVLSVAGLVWCWDVASPHSWRSSVDAQLEMQGSLGLPCRCEPVRSLAVVGDCELTGAHR